MPKFYLDTEEKGKGYIVGWMGRLQKTRDWQNNRKGGSATPPIEGDDFSFAANGAVVQPSILQVQKPSDRLGDFTVVRGSNATYVDSGGIIKEAYQLSDDLVTNGDFENGSNGWSVNDGARVVISDGACEIDSTDGNALLFQDILTDGKNYAASIDVLSYNGVGEFRIINSTGASYGNIKTIGTNIVLFTHSDASPSFLVQGLSGAIGTIDNVLVKEVSYDIARIDWTNGVGELLTEPQSTNLVTQSYDFSSPWIAENCTVNPDVQNSPDDNVTGTSRINLIASDGAALKFNDSSASGVHTMSIWVRRVLTSNDDDFRMAYYNVTDDIVYSPTFTATNEWQRFEWSPAPTVGNNQWWFISNPTSVERDFLIWGAQLEELPYATSYIPTNGSTVTRLQDQITNGANVNVINSDEGVLFWEGSSISPTPQGKFISISVDGSDDDRIAIWVADADDTYSCRFSQSGVDTYRNFGSTEVFENSKLAVRWGPGGVSRWINGIEIGSDPFVGFGAQMNICHFASAQYKVENFFGRTRELKVYDRALTDEELIEITTV